MAYKKLVVQKRNKMSIDHIISTAFGVVHYKMKL